MDVMEPSGGAESPAEPGAVKIEALVKPYLLEDVKESLGELGLDGLTVSEVRDFGTGQASVVPFQPRLKLEVVVPESLFFPAMEQIRSTGQIPDSATHLFHAQRLTDVVRIRTAERGAIAI